MAIKPVQGTQADPAINQNLKTLDKNRMLMMLNTILGIATTVMYGYMAMHDSHLVLQALDLAGIGIGGTAAVFSTVRAVQTSKFRNALKKEHGIIHEREEMQYSLGDMKSDLERTINCVQKKFNSIKYMLMTP